jgi:hypothetical protein
MKNELLLALQAASKGDKKLINKFWIKYQVEKMLLASMKR